MEQIHIIKTTLVEIKESLDDAVIVMLKHKYTKWRYPIYSIKQGNYFWATRSLHRRAWSTLNACMCALEEEISPLLIPIKEELKEGRDYQIFKG
tara:strand:- start:14 stop:295 length:282 start_codon:yes stop_codon:yes gene_type:complete